MKLDNNLDQIPEHNFIENIDDHSFIENVGGNGLNQMLNNYYQTLNDVQKITSHASIAHMNEIVISTDDKPIIGTQALDTCYGILLYDRDNKFGICGHASPNNTIGITIEMLKKISTNEERFFEYIIIPGYRAIRQHNFHVIDEIIEVLNYYSSLHSNVKFISFKTSISPSMPEGLLCYDFAFDTISGEDATSIIFFRNQPNKFHI